MFSVGVVGISYYYLEATKAKDLYSSNILIYYMTTSLKFEREFLRYDPVASYIDNSGQQVEIGLVISTHSIREEGVKAAGSTKRRDHLRETADGIQFSDGRLEDGVRLDLDGRLFVRTDGVYNPKVDDYHLTKLIGECRDQELSPDEAFDFCEAELEELLPAGNPEPFLGQQNIEEKRVRPL
jgi:hypothetical protein